MTFQFFSKNSKLLPLNEAVVSVFNIEYAYGFGVYENVRVQGRLPYFLSDHIDRLLASAQVIGLEHNFSKQELESSATELVEAIASDPPSQGGLPTGQAGRGVLDGSQTYNLKILLVGARERGAVQLYILPLAPLFPNRKLYQSGASVMSLSHERLFPAAKTLNMLPSYIYYTQAKAKGYYDVLFCDRASNILEGSRTNFFAIKNKTIYTAPRELVLEGVTRKYVLQVAREHGFTVVEQNIPLTSLRDFDGAFLTSTSSKIVPLHKISARDVVTPPYPPLKRGGGGTSPLFKEGITGEVTSIEFATIAPAIKDLMKYFNEFLEKYKNQK